MDFTGSPGSYVVRHPCCVYIWFENYPGGWKLGAPDREGFGNPLHMTCAVHRLKVKQQLYIMYILYARWKNLRWIYFYTIVNETSARNPLSLLPTMAWRVDYQHKIVCSQHRWEHHAIILGSTRETSTGVVFQWRLCWIPCHGGVAPWVDMAKWYLQFCGETWPIVQLCISERLRTNMDKCSGDCWACFRRLHSPRAHRPTMWEL